MNKTAYTIQRNGQVTLPPALRQEYNLQAGDQVAFRRVKDGWLVTKKEIDPLALLDMMGDMLDAKGISLEELIADGEKIREQLAEEMYGLKLDANN